MNRSRRCVLLAPVIAMAFGAAYAQNYPSRPIKIVVAAAAGTASDLFARFIADRLGGELNTSVVVENKVGANGILGTDAVAKAQPDGYTLLQTNSTHFINKSLYTKVPYDPVRDFKPLMRGAATFQALVVPGNSPFKTLRNVLDYARANPDKVTYSTGGTGSTLHLAGVQLAKMANVRLLHIPYKGGDMALKDTIGGQVSMGFTAIATALPHLQSGNLRMLAVTGLQRSAVVPEVPTIAESGFPNFEIGSRLGIMGPAGMPADVVQKLSVAMFKIGQSPQFSEFIKPRGMELDLADAPAYTTDAVKEMEMWSKIVTISGVKLE